MGNISTKGPIACYNDLQGKSSFSKKGLKKSVSTDVKINSFAQSTLKNEKPPQHVVNNIGHQAIIKIFPEIFAGKKRPFLPRERKSSIKRVKRFQINDNYPIGIKSSFYNNWINALMQFIIFVPSLMNMFDFTAKSLRAFSSFIDLYLLDQLNNKIITSAESNILIECLYQKFGVKTFLSQSPFLNLFSVLKLLMLQLRNYFFEEETYQNCLLALHPEWQLEYQDINISIDDFVQSNVNNFPEFLLSFALFFEDFEKYFHFRKYFNPQKFFFVCKEKALCYELNAFIEYRPDDENNGSYVTYLKKGGCWYQMR